MLLSKPAGFIRQDSGAVVVKLWGKFSFPDIYKN